MIGSNLIIITSFVFIVVALLVAAVNILREYERGVVFTLGRYTGVKGPGLVLVIPLVQRLVRADLRTMVHDVPTQEVITRDNVSGKVNAVVYFRIIDAARAFIQVEDFYRATSQLAQTTLRSVLGKHELDELLAERDKLNQDIQEILDSQTVAWGVKVTNVEVKHVELDESMVRAIAKQAEAERLRRAKVIGAEGEWQAAARLVDAATTLEREPSSLQLRYLSTLQEIASDRSIAIVLPLPIELFDMMRSRAAPSPRAKAEGTQPSRASAPPD